MKMKTPQASQLIGIEDAILHLVRRAPIRDSEYVEISDAFDRILAEDVIALSPVPAHHNSAMDGYAFRLSDLPADGRLPISSRVAAGHPVPNSLLPGTAARIFTGGVIPEGADTVAMQEDCTVEDSIVKVLATLRLGANIRLAGDDIAQNNIALMAGARLRPQDIGIAAAVGRTKLLVSRRLQVAVVATGDELRSPGQLLPTGCIYDSNRHAIIGALRSLGAHVNDFGILPDQRQLIRGALAEAARNNDLVISSGGMSVGEEDYVRPAIEEIGFLDFWKLRLKPGKPVAAGEIAGTPFIGLPGNAVSAMVTFWLLVRPLVLHLMGARNLSVPRFDVRADFHHRHLRGRREFLRARHLGRDGCDAG
jgi:molybdopterin molybdotransferase